MKKEFLIGLLALIALSALGYVTAVVQNWQPFKERTDYTVVFQRINGLKVDDQVLYSGMNIGHVSSISFNDNHNIVVTMSLDTISKLTVPTDVIITIEDRTVLGGKQLSMFRPSSSMNVDAPPGYQFKGENPSDILKNAAETLKKVGDGFDSLKDLLDGEGTIKKLFLEDSLHKDAEEAFRNLAEITKKINEDKGEKGGTISQLLNDPQPYNDLKEFVGKLNELHIDLTADSYVFPEDNYSLTHAGVILTTSPDKFYSLGAHMITKNHETRIATPRAIARQKDTIIYPTVMIGRRFLEHKNLALSAGMLEGEFGARASFYLIMPEDRIGLHFEGRSRIRDKNIRENNENLMARFYVDYEMNFDSFPTMRVTAGAHNIFDDTQGFVGIGFSFRDDDLKYVMGAISGGP
jgi:phospholipid/cholesterol/gamma-HCH transport system substrate-binding protein